MGVTSALKRWRRREGGNFSSAVQVERTVAGGTFDEGTGAITPADPEVVYSGPALVRAATWVGTDTTTGEREVRFRAVRVKLPHDTPVRMDDQVIVTSDEHDADLVGQVFRITDVLHDGWQVNRVVIAEAVSGGAGG